MDYIKYCAAVDAAALRFVSEVAGLCYLTQQQIAVYIIGRTNEVIREAYPHAEISTDYRTYYDLHELGVWDHYVTTTIQQNGRAFYYETLIRYKDGEYKHIQREAPLIVQFQERAQQYAVTEFRELSGNSSLSTSEFLNQLEERIAGRLEDYYSREGFEVSITAHIGLSTSYTIQIEDPADGQEVTVEIKSTPYVEDAPVTLPPFILEVEGEKRGECFELNIKDTTEAQERLTKVQAIVEIVKRTQDKLSDIHLELEDRLDEEGIAEQIRIDIHAWLGAVFGEKFTFTVRVETTDERITVYVEEAYSGCKTRLRSTRKLEPQE